MTITHGFPRGPSYRVDKWRYISGSCRRHIRVVYRTGDGQCDVFTAASSFADVSVFMDAAAAVLILILSNFQVGRLSWLKKGQLTIPAMEKEIGQRCHCSLYHTLIRCTPKEEYRKLIKACQPNQVMADEFGR